MHDDLEARYHHTSPAFLKVMPEGFAMGGETVSCIEVSIQDEQVERKLWDQGRLLCHSRDGRRAVKTRKPCRVCRNQLRCTSQIVLYVLHDDTPFRIPLNYTSAENYLAYRREVMNGDADPAAVMTTLHVTPRGSWGEVSFTKLF
jgi:hypothetical protein